MYNLFSRKRQLGPDDAFAAYPVMITHEESNAAYHSYIFYIGNNEITVSLPYLLSNGAYIQLPQTEAYEAQGLIMKIASLHEDKSGKHVMLSPEELPQNFTTLQRESFSKAADDDDLTVVLMDMAGKVKNKFSRDAVPMPWSEFVQGKRIYSPKQVWWDFSNSKSATVYYYCEIEEHQRGAQYSGTTSKNSRKLPKLISDPVLLQQAMQNHVKDRISLEDIERRFVPMVAKMQSKVMFNRERKKLNDRVWHYFRQKLQEMFEIKNTGSITQRWRAVFRGAFWAIKSIGSLIPVPKVSEFWETALDKVYDKIKGRWKEQDERFLHHADALTRIDAATNSALEDGVAKIVYLYWQMMYLYQKIKSVPTNIIKGDKFVAQNILNELLELEEIQDEAKSILDVILCFAQQMRDDASNMDTLVDKQRILALTEMFNIVSSEESVARKSTTIPTGTVFSPNFIPKPMGL